MLAPELITLLIGSTTGFLFRFMAEKRLAEKEMFERLMNANERTNKNANEAVRRVPLDAGKSVRRLIVLIVLFATIIAPFVLPFFGLPTIVEYTETTPEYFFGIIPSTSRTVFQEINGYLFTQENREILLSIVGFYFGNAAAGNKT